MQSKLGWVLAIALLATPAWGQQGQEWGQPAQGGWTPTPGTAPAPGPGPYNPPPGGTTFSNPNGGLYAPGTQQAPAGVAPAPLYQPPGAAFQGNVTAPPTWDPYAPQSGVPSAGPYNPAGPSYYEPPPALFPDGRTSIFAPGTYAYTNPDGTVGALPRLFREIRFEYTWLAETGDEPFGINSLELTGTTQWAFFYQQAPLTVTPGFAIHYLSGPVSPAPGVGDLPPRVYDAFLDAGWRPEITPWLGADLGFRIGVYTDFEHATTDSIRIMGHGLGVLTFSPALKFALGVVYVDRINVKLLPAGGVIWTPDEDTRWEILFPQPKLAKRLTTIGTTDFWWYVAGEYGGGRWTVRRGEPEIGDLVGYNDIRVIGGLEWFTLSKVRGNFEVGYVFDREIIYRTGPPDRIRPSDTVMLRAAIAF